MAVDEMDIVCEDEVAGTLGFYEVKVHPEPQRTGGKQEEDKGAEFRA